MKLLVLTFMVSFATLRIQAQSGLCSSGVPFFHVDLRHSPSATFISPSGSRSNNCCGTSFPDRCVEFEVFLHPSSTGIRFDIYSGAVPPGAMFYQINCGPQIPVGQFVCLAGQGPHTITFCKPGNNPNSYFIEAIPALYSIKDTTTRIDCPVMLKGEGLNPSTVTWRDITGGGMYDNLLSCTLGCYEALFTPVPGIPNQIKYEVCGSVLDTVCNNYYPVCDTLTVTIHPEVSIAPMPIQKYCSTSGGILISPTVTGGRGNYTYEWKDSLGNVVSNNRQYFASKGSYSFSANDYYTHCPPKTILIIVEEDLPAIVDAGNDTLICNSAGTISINGTITLAPSGIWSGGTGPLVYHGTTLSNQYNITQQDINNGSVQFILRSVGDTVCPAVRDTVVVSIATALNAQLSVKQISCNAINDGAITVNASGSVPPYTYSLDGFMFQNSNVFSNLVDGDYNVWVRDNLGCEVVLSATIVPPMTMVSNLSSNAPVCTGQQLSFHAYTPGATIYNWSGPNGYTAIGDSVIINNVTLLQTGMYRVTISNTYCVIHDSIFIQVNASPVARAGNNVTACWGTTVQLGANPSATGGNGNYVFSWTDDSGLFSSSDASPIIIVDRSERYNLLVTDGNNCTSNDYVNVTMPSLMNVTSNTFDVNCFGGNDGEINIGVMGGNNPYRFQWSNGATTQNLYNITASIYYVTITDNNNCIITDSFFIQQPDLLSIQGNVTDASCFDFSNGSIDISISGGIVPYTYSWSNNSTNKDISDVKAGNYRVTVIDANGCMQIELFAVTQPTPYNVSLTTSNVQCYAENNGVIDLTVSGATSPYNYMWNDANTNEDRTNLFSGYYEVTVSDANGCVIDTFATIFQPDTLMAVYTTTNVSCNGNNNGAIDVTISGGILPYSYLWSNGSITQDLNNILSGTYLLTITDANNCNVELIAEIQQPDILILDAQIEHVKCFDGNDGRIITAVSGGTTPYSYLWNNNSTTSNLLNLESGNYEITVVDAQGCSVSENIVITQPTLLEAVGITRNVSCNGYEDGVIAINTFGGTAPYSFNWSNNYNADMHNELASGYYTITVSDANGCVKNLEYTILQPEILMVNLSGTELICINANNGKIEAQVSGGTPFYNYTWSNGSSFSTINNLIANTYTLTVHDAFGCSVTGNFTVNEYEYSIEINTSDNELCFGDTISFNATLSGSANANYIIWSVNNGANIYSNSFATNIYNVGSNNASVIAVLDNNCIANANVLFLVHGLPNVNAGNNVVICPGNNTTLEATGALSYVWHSDESFIQVSNSIIRTSPDSTSIYFVTGTDSNGCVNFDSVMVSLHEIIPLEISNDTLLCAGSNTILKVEGAVSYVWNNSQFLSCDTCSTTIALPNATTTFTVNAVDINGCNVSDSVIVYVVPMPSGLLSQSLTTCENSEVTLRAFPQANVTYSWQPDSLVSNANSHTIKVTPSETTTFTLSSTTNFGCNRIDTVIITVLPKPFLNIDDSISYCFGESYQIQLDSSLNYTWQPTIGLSCSQCSNPLITNSTNQIYTVSYVANNGCSFTDTIQLNVLSLPELDLGVSRKICNGDIVNITAEAPTATSILWSPSQGLNSTNTKIVQASPNADIVYTATVSDANGCVNSDSILVEVINEVQIHLDSLFNICIGEMITIIPSILAASDAHIQYSWLPENRFNNPNAESQTIMPRNAESYQLIVSSGSCIPDTQSFFVNVYQGPSVFITAPEYVIAGQNFEVSAEAIGASIYNWQYDENNLLGYESSIIAQIFQPTTFTVNVTDENNCSATQFRIVKVIDNCGDNIFIPNAFTPNGDEINDKLCIRSLELEGIKIFRIFNRWGELVFETTDLNHCWDGYYKGKIVNPDVYVYYAEGICTNGQNKLIKGNVTVLR